MIKRKIENMHQLFPLIVRFPVLRPYAERLASLPLDPLYRMLWYMWYGYVFKIKLTKIHSYRLELPYLIKLYFRMLNKS